MDKSIINKFHSIKNKKIILASESPRRKKILKDLGFHFKAIKSNVNEKRIIASINNHFKKDNVYRLVKLLSLSKAISVLNKTKNKGYIIGCDTIVVCENKIIGKPQNKKDALKKIMSLSGKSHKVITAISIINTKNFDHINHKMNKEINTLKKLLNVYHSPLSICDYDTTKVSMKHISYSEANAYISSKEPFGKAGAYAIQGKGRKFVNAIDGDFYTVVGFPVDKFYLMFKALI